MPTSATEIIVGTLTGKFKKAAENIGEEIGVLIPVDSESNSYLHPPSPLPSLHTAAEPMFTPPPSPSVTETHTRWRATPQTHAHTYTHCSCHHQAIELWEYWDLVPRITL